MRRRSLLIVMLILLLIVVSSFWFKSYLTGKNNFIIKNRNVFFTLEKLEPDQNIYFSKLGDADYIGFWVLASDIEIKRDSENKVIGVYVKPLNHIIFKPLVLIKTFGPSENIVLVEAGGSPNTKNGIFSYDKIDKNKPVFVAVSNIGRDDKFIIKINCDEKCKFDLAQIACSIKNFYQLGSRRCPDTLHFVSGTGRARRLTDRSTTSDVSICRTCCNH